MCLQRRDFYGVLKYVMPYPNCLFVKCALPVMTPDEKVYILQDKQFLFDGYFGYSEIPSIYVYNQQWQRVKAFNKETPADVLLRFL